MKTHKPTRDWRAEYNRLFHINPMTANVFLLLTELANERGCVEVSEADLARLMAARFEDPQAWALEGLEYE